MLQKHIIMANRTEAIDARATQIVVHMQTLLIDKWSGCVMSVGVSKPTKQY